MKNILFLSLILALGCGNDEETKLLSPEIIQVKSDEPSGRELTSCDYGEWFLNSNISVIQPYNYGETMEIYVNVNQPPQDMQPYTVKIRFRVLFGNPVAMFVTGGTGGGPIAVGGSKDLVVTSTVCFNPPGNGGTTYTHLATVRFNKGPGAYTYTQMDALLYYVNPSHTISTTYQTGIAFTVNL